MKIGILTHQSVNNFGAFLQCWALQEKIKALFPDDEVCVINFIIPKQNLFNTGGFFRFYIGTETPKSWIHKLSQLGIFKKTRKEHINLTKRVYNAEQINSLGLDCIVVGSDEVWNFLDNKTFSLVKFSGGLNAKRIVAYAPSVGKSTTDNIPDEVRAAMKGFTALSARDKGAQELCKKALGKTPELVCDPTFLTPTPKIDNEKIKKLTEKPYVLFYYCNGIPHELKKRIIEGAHKKGYAVIGAGEYDKMYSQMSIKLDSFEWAELFRRAEYVYTGTFHGVVFSILNRKDFRVYASIESRVKKINALLGQFGIGSRDLDPNADFAAIINNDKIDYDKVYEYVEKLRKSSSDYLLRSVGGDAKAEGANDRKQG
nr:polysaccharide pyruvyl transferase family protein [uncultured Ruminococcus sp.]